MTLTANPTTTTGSIAERAMLSDLTIRQWTAIRQDKSAARETTNAHGASAEMGRFSKHLIDPKHLAPITKAAAAAHVEHRTRTLPWLDSGPRILPAAGFFVYESAMRTHESTFQDAVSAFAAHYPEHVAEGRQKLGSLWDPRHYPTPAAIRDAFAIGYNVIPFPTATDFRVDIPQDVLDRLTRAYVETERQIISAAMRDVAERINTTVGHMAARLRIYKVATTGTEGVFRDSLVTNVRDLAALLPALNITADPTLAAVTERIANELTLLSPDTLRVSTAARNRTAAAAEAILDAMKDFAA